MNMAKIENIKLICRNPFLYTNDEKSERETKETKTCMTTNLPKETKDVYAENYEALKKDQR